jgi:hypothetical protein
MQEDANTRHQRSNAVQNCKLFYPRGELQTRSNEAVWWQNMFGYSEM